MDRRRTPLKRSVSEATMINLNNESSTSRRILLVDDDNSLRDAVDVLLTSENFEVIPARNGRDGLTIFHRALRPIGLLVTDCEMPGMTGLELAQACARRNPRVAVLYISGALPNEELQEDLATRRRAFLAKPFGGEALLRKVRELLSPVFGPKAIPPSPRVHAGFQLLRSMRRAHPAH
jgi:DNA-binding NtrC family response regulator